MKKTLIYAVVAGLLLSSTMAFANEQAPADVQKQPTKGTPCKKDFKGQKPPRPNFDERLKLTEEQKKQAHELRMKGHDKMKPLMEKMKAKKEEAKAVKNDAKLSEKDKEKKLEPIRKEIKKIKQEARKIREENTKAFEAILTDEQKAEFEKIKQEGREKFKQQHKKGHNGMKKCPPPQEKQ